MNIIHVTTKKDLATCLAIRREVFIHEQNVEEALEIDEMDALPSACHHFLLRVNNEPTATGRFIKYDERTAKFQRIAVKKAYRGKGFGRNLILQMEEITLKNGFQYSLLDSQCQAEKFYQQLGYSTISDEPFYDANILHVRMKKKLK